MTMGQWAIARVYAQMVERARVRELSTYERMLRDELKPAVEYYQRREDLAAQPRVEHSFTAAGRLP